MELKQDIPEINIKYGDLSSVEDQNRKVPNSISWNNFVTPRTITGPAHLLNKGAVDWAHHGLMAYGANCTVFVVDTKNVQIVQSLDKHKTVIKKLLWVTSSENRTDGLSSLQLISGDSSGVIVHWDVANSNALAVLQDGNKPVLGMEWVPGLENELMLAALHSPYFFIIWDITKQSKLWKKSFTDTLLSFNFNPFNGSQLAFLCPDGILFVDDFQIGRIPSTNGRKFYISSPRIDSGADEHSKGRDRLKKLVRGMVVGETKPKPEEAMTLTECLQLTYHKSLRDYLILLYPRDVLLIDLHINQTVGIITIEKSMSPLVHVVSSKQRDVLYLLHEFGSVGVKLRKKYNLNSLSPCELNTDNLNNTELTLGSELYMSYEHKYQSESIRQNKGSKVISMAVDPISERKIGVIFSSGKVIFLDLLMENNKFDNYNHVCLSDMISLKNPEYINLKLLPSAVLPVINGSVTAAKMCPSIFGRHYRHLTDNRKLHCPLLAVGTNTGYVYIINLSQGIIYKELAVHNSPVRGIEWIGLRSFFSFAHSDGNKVKNEIFMTNLMTGHSVPVRNDRPLENPMTLIKISPFRQYFIVILKQTPLELWEFDTLTLLRTMPKKFPLVTALEWSPFYCIKPSKETTLRRLSKDKDYEEMKLGKETKEREHLVFANTESQLFYFTVENEGLKDGIQIQESNINLVTSLAFKSNHLVQGDVDGKINVWDVKGKTSKSIFTNRGGVKNLKFSPGKTERKLLVLYADGIDIFDLSQDYQENKRSIAQLKWGRDDVKIAEADWASTDIPVVLTEDGWIRIFDNTLTKSSSPIHQYNLTDIINCPSLLAPKLFNKIQFLLCTQFWKDAPDYTAFSVQDGFKEQEIILVNQQLGQFELDISNFGKLNTAEKCLKTSRLLGDVYGIDFWMVTTYYLQVAANNYKSVDSNTDPKETNSSKTFEFKRTNKHPDIEPLDSCYDFLVDPYNYQKHELERVTMHEWKRGDYQHNQRVVERLILLGEVDRAVQLLLETDIDNPGYYLDAIKACLVSTIQQTGEAQSTIKLVATNLIANGKIWEGVQLLCLIGKGLDGCRYLISYGSWNSAVWLAKSVLPPFEMFEIMKKYADHLANDGDMFGAILVLISQCQFDMAIEMLFSQRQVLSAGLLLIACQDYNIEVNQTLKKSVISLLCEYLGSIMTPKNAAASLAERLKTAK